MSSSLDRDREFQFKRRIKGGKAWTVKGRMVVLERIPKRKLRLKGELVPDHRGFWMLQGIVVLGEQ